jgi:hypothetical protein
MEGFFDKYKATYTIYNGPMDKECFKEIYLNNDYLYGIIQKYGGSVFKKGLFKIHTFDYVKKWTKLLTEYFSQKINFSKIICFASNWQGTMYCVDNKNETVICFDPLKHEYSSEKISLEQFFYKTLVDKKHDIIFEERFDKAFPSLKIIELDYGDSITGTDENGHFKIINTELLWKTK